MLEDVRDFPELILKNPQKYYWNVSRISEIRKGLFLAQLQKKNCISKFEAIFKVF